MDLEKYRVLVKVIQTSSYTKAAEDTGYSVSGISRLVSSLEKEQGFPLIYRNHDGIKATKEMETLLPYVLELLYHERLINEVAANIKGTQKGSIAIGVAYSNYYHWIAERAKAFQEEHPHIHFEFVDGYSSELLAQLETHELDMCLSSQREGNPYRWKQLGLEELVAWLPKGHEKASDERVPLEIVVSENYIDIYPGKDIDNARILTKYHITPSSRIAVSDSYAAYSMVEAGLGISLNHRSICEKWSGDVVIKPLDPEIRIPVGLYAGKTASPVVEEFWRFLTG